MAGFVGALETPGTIDLTITRGDAAVIDILVTDHGVPVDLTTGKTLIVTAKRSLSDPDANAIFQKRSPSTGIVLTAPTKGQAQMTLANADTVSLPNRPYALEADCQLLGAAVSPRTIARGRILVVDEVTQATA